MGQEILVDRSVRGTLCEKNTHLCCLAKDYTFSNKRIFHRCVVEFESHLDFPVVQAVLESLVGHVDLQLPSSQPEV